MKEFTVGDVVTSEKGIGVVINVYENLKRPVCVRFIDGGYERFTLNGKMNLADEHQSLFHALDEQETW